MPEVDAEILVTEKQFACGCGFASATKSGLTNHKKTCPSNDVPVPGVKIKAERVYTEPPLTTVDRNQFTKRIQDRSKAILVALADELDGNPERMLENLRREKGITLTVAQIQELVEGMDRQIENEIGDHISDEEERIKVATADLEEEYDEIERDMKERHHKEWREMRDQKKAKIQGFRQSLKDVKEKVTAEKVGELKSQRDKYKLQLIRTRQLEQEIKFTQEQRLALLKRQRGRLLHIIGDATNRALEKLLVTSSRTEAGALIESIPTASEALNMCSSPEGFVKFMKQLDPSHQLPAPANMEIDAETLKQAKLEDEKEEAKRNREEDDENDDSDHEDHDSEVYDEDDDEEDTSDE